MSDKEARQKGLESFQTLTISREVDEAPRARTALAAPAKGGWRRRFCGLGAMAALGMLLLLVSVSVGLGASWWRQGTVWKEFNRDQKLMYLQGYSAGFLAGAQQAFKNPDGLKDFYKSLAKTSFRQGEVLISQYLKNNPQKMSEPLGTLIFEAYTEAVRGASKAPERVIAAKSAPKPPEPPVAKDIPKAPEKVPPAQAVPKAPEKAPVPQQVSKDFAESKLGATGQSQLPKSSEKIKEVPKSGVQTKTAVKPLATSAYTPPRESDERKALFRSLSEYMDPSRILRLSFVVKYLKVNNGWAWVLALPQSRDGEIQYRPVYALLRHEGGLWKVVAHTRVEKNTPDFLLSTGYLEKLTKRFPEAPSDIFPPHGDTAAKSAPKPSEPPVAKSIPKAPEKVPAAQAVPKTPEKAPAAQAVPKAPEKAPAAQQVSKSFEEIQLGAAGQSQLPKSSEKIKEATKSGAQTKTAVKPLTTSAYTPPRDSDERKALFLSLSEHMDPSRILRLSFVVKSLKVNNGWAWVLAVPQSRDGEIQYRPVYALLHHKGGFWKVEAYTRMEKNTPDFLFSTGYLEKLTKRFPEAPADIFPRKGD